MTIEKLETISSPYKMFSTAGSKPILVHCNDLEDWVCKYDYSTKNLFNELVASIFARNYNLETPKCSLIKVNKDLIDVNKDGFSNLDLTLFDKICFGSKFISEAKEIDFATELMFEKKSFLNNISNYNDYLKIAMFDIWMCNEDRNYNNRNMLLSPNYDGKYSFVVIDHVAIFNSNAAKDELYEITEEDSIINTDIAKIMYFNKKNLNTIVDNIVKEHYICVKECKKHLNF